MAGRISLRPSEAETWIECTMAPVFIADNAHRIPKDDGTVWSEEGTLAHELAAKLLKDGEADIPDHNMRVILDGYVEFVLDKWAPGEPLLIEQSVPLWYMPDRKGNVDAIVMRLSESNLYITDLKYGEGVAVYARNNPQLAIYGRSVVEHLKKQGHKIGPGMLITLAVYQPRCSKGDKISLWALSYDELIEFTDEIAVIATDIQARQNLRWHKSRSTCRWCKAAAICPEVARKNLGASGPGLVQNVLPELVSDEIRQIPAVEFMTVEMMVRVFEMREEFNAWFTAIEKHLFGLLNSGVNDPALKYKLVNKKAGSREWVDPELARDFLANYLDEDTFAPRSLISAPQAEKLVPATHQDADYLMMWDMLVRKKPSTGRTMVPLDDERESVVVNAADEFQPIFDVGGADLL